MNFQGFKPRAFTFLFDVYTNDSKQWYEAHKGEYDTFIKEPFFDMIFDLTPTVRTVDFDIMTEPKRCLSRIYRDARYARGKTKYRNSAWITFHCPTNDEVSYPEFFVEITDSFCRWGMGAYAMQAKEMAELRKFIAENPDEFKKIIKPFSKNKGLHIAADYYKKTHRDSPEVLPEGLEEWFQIKSFYMTSGNLPCDVMADGKIVETIARDFEQLGGFYNLLKNIISNLAAENYSKQLSALNFFE